jgi:hypothetical protein
MCTHCLDCIHPPTPFPATSPFPLVPTAPPSGQNLFHPPVLKFCGRKNMFSHICVSQHHLFQSILLLPSQLSMVALNSLKYSFLYSEQINLIQVFGFLPLPYPSLAQPPLSVTHVP